MTKFIAFNPHCESLPYGGVHFVFANGWTVSVQWKVGNYCDEDGSTAEIAAWDESGDWYRFDTGDTVLGWRTPDQVVAFMALIAAA